VPIIRIILKWGTSRLSPHYPALSSPHYLDEYNLLTLSDFPYKVLWILLSFPDPLGSTGI
jgi:hypothetical protein